MVEESVYVFVCVCMCTCMCAILKPVRGTKRTKGLWVKVTEQLWRVVYILLYLDHPINTTIITAATPTRWYFTTFITRYNKTSCYSHNQ